MPCITIKILSAPILSFKTFINLFKREHDFLCICLKSEDTLIVNKCKVPSLYRINSGIREAIDLSTIDAKEHDICDRRIVIYNRAESTDEEEKRRLNDDFNGINDFVNEGLHIQATTIKSNEKQRKYIKRLV